MAFKDKLTIEEKTSLKRIIIIGARLDGQAGVVLDALEEIGGYEVVCFIDNTPELQNKLVSGLPVIGSTENLERINYPVDSVHIAIGDNVARGKIFKTINKLGLKAVTITHPTAYISKNTVIREGSFVGPNAVINNGVDIGEACIINSGAIIEHDCKVGFAVHLAPGTKTAGRVHIGDYSFIGVGATVLQDVKIGSGVMIGGGATVIKHVPSNTTMIGYTAKKHTKNIYADIEPDVSSTQKIYIAQPTLPDFERINTIFSNIFKSRMLSNFSKYSAQLEMEIQEILHIKRALTFPNATSALMLIHKILGLKGEVILPSFTFAATGHALLWNGLTPVFADIDPDTLNIDPDDIERKITEKTSAILAVHIFGNPCDISRLQSIAKKYNLNLIFDSAHAFGSQYNGKMIGNFGDLECFSLSGTKVMTSAEGGIVTSNNDELMDKISLGRNYGARDDYNCHYVGLNGKMSEFHAAIALESLSLLEEFVRKRNELIKLYHKRLSEMPGITFQLVSEENVSTYKDFCILINEESFGINRDELIDELNKEGIFTKKYFYPPLHQMSVYQDIKYKAEGLTNTIHVANSIVCLPIYSHMSIDILEKVCFAIYRIWSDKNRGAFF